MNIGKILNDSFRLLKETGLLLKNGLNIEPTSMAGTRNKTAKNQYPIPTRQIIIRLSSNFNPAFPSNNAVIIIPAIEAERTEDKGSDYKYKLIYQNRKKIFPTYREALTQWIKKYGKQTTN